jgi:hypothetical protein
MSRHGEGVAQHPHDAGVVHNRRDRLRAPLNQRPERAVGVLGASLRVRQNALAIRLSPELMADPAKLGRRSEPGNVSTVAVRSPGTETTRTGAQAFAAKQRSPSVNLWLRGNFSTAGISQIRNW